MATSTVARRPSRRKSRGNGIGRTAYGRIVHIHERLGNERRVNATTLAGELGVSPRTIKRDIGQMRDELGAPVVWEPSTHTYFYDKPCDHLPLLRLTADEALALVLASETFAAWRGSALGRALTAAFGKIAGVAAGAVSLPVSEVRPFIFQPEAGEEAKAEHRWFAVALEAIRRRRELAITYLKPGAKLPQTRVVHPLHLAFLEHRWMLVAHDLSRRARRNFLLARIRDARPGGRSFEPPPGFDARSCLSGNLGRFTGDGEHVVRVTFDATVAPYLRERPWHPSQTIVDRADGGIEVELRLNNLIDVRRWILACGSHAEVLAPAELRETVRREAEAMAARHRPPF